MVTVQSATCQPCRPWPSVSRTVSSTALKKAYGIDPSSTSSRNPTPEPTGAGSTRSPTVARNGLASLLDELDGRAGADRPLDAQIGRRLAEADVEAELVGQRGLDDLLLHLPVQGHGGLLPDLVVPQVDQRVLLGELGECEMQGALVGPVAAARRPFPGSAVRSSARPSAFARYAEGVADPDVGQAPEPADPARRHLVVPEVRAPVEDADRGDLALSSPSPKVTPVAGAHACPRTSARTRSSPPPVRARP